MREGCPWEETRQQGKVPRWKVRRRRPTSPVDCGPQGETADVPQDIFIHSELDAFLPVGFRMCGRSSLRLARRTSYPARLNGARFLGALRMALYESDLIPEMPRALYAARSRSEDEVLRRGIGLQQVIRESLVDVGAAFSFACYETVPFTDRQRLRAEAERFAWLRHAATEFTLPAVCSIWGVPPGPVAEHEPVESTIPTLLLSGEYDPATPPSNAKSVARSLSRSFQITFPGLGHWVTANNVSDCPQRITLQFLDTPGKAPDCTCVGTMRTQWSLK